MSEGQAVKHFQNGDYELALKECESSNQPSQQGSKLHEVKMACLISLGRFQQILESNARTSPNLHSVYALYKLNRLQEASQMLSSLGHNHQSGDVMLLKAQIAYKMDDYKQAADLYKQMIDSTSAEFQSVKDELHTNYLACLAGSRFQSSTSAPIVGAEDSNLGKLESDNNKTFEQLYNLACCQLAGGSVQKAKALLQRALETGQRALKADGYSDSEIGAELLDVRVQLAFVDLIDKSARSQEEILHELEDILTLYNG